MTRPDLSVTMGEELYHAAYAVFAYWWSPPDAEHSPTGDRAVIGAGSFVGVLPPPALYAERLALSLRKGM